jgi:hypothetical protein
LGEKRERETQLELTLSKEKEDKAGEGERHTTNRRLSDPVAFQGFQQRQSGRNINQIVRLVYWNTREHIP